MELAARFFNSRGVPAPSIFRNTRPRLNAPMWINRRFKMLSRPRKESSKNNLDKL